MISVGVISAEVIRRFSLRGKANPIAVPTLPSHRLKRNNNLFPPLPSGGPATTEGCHLKNELNQRIAGMITLSFFQALAASVFVVASPLFR